MTADVLFGALFTFLMGWMLVAAISSAVEARRALGIMGSYGPSDWVIWGISGLAGAIISSAFTIVLQRVLFFMGEPILPIEIRTALFVGLLILVCASFTSIAYGFHKQAEQIIALRRHWLYQKGIHLPAESLSIESSDDEEWRVEEPGYNELESRGAITMNVGTVFFGLGTLIGLGALIGVIDWSHIELIVLVAYGFGFLLSWMPFRRPNA